MRVMIAVLLGACSPSPRHGGLDGGVDASAADAPIPWSNISHFATGPREQHTSNTLLDGRLLVAGGEDLHSVLATSELYDPASNAWTRSGDMTVARQGHESIVLADGSVFVAGGYTDLTGRPTASVDTYVPSTGMWVAGAMAMNVARVNFAMSKLKDGRVLAAGGRDGIGDTYTASAESYDPVTKQWTVVASMSTPRSEHTATVLLDGRVLIVGGFDGSSAVASAELYDPSTNQFTATAPMPTARILHVATLLPDGRVLVSGGIDANNMVLTSALLYDGSTNTWTETGSMATPRILPTATLLSSGQVLITGGDSSTATPMVERTTEAFNPATGMWIPTGTMMYAREAHSATLMTAGFVLVSGGFVGGTEIVTDTTELFNPASIIL